MDRRVFLGHGAGVIAAGARADFDGLGKILKVLTDSKIKPISDDPYLQRFFQLAETSSKTESEIFKMNIPEDDKKSLVIKLLAKVSELSGDGITSIPIAQMQLKDFITELKPLMNACARTSHIEKLFSDNLSEEKKSYEERLGLLSNSSSKFLRKFYELNISEDKKIDFEYRNYVPLMSVLAADGKIEIAEALRILNRFCGDFCKQFEGDEKSDNNSSKRRELVSNLSRYQKSAKAV